MNSGGAGGMLGGQAISSPGAMMDRTAVPSVSLELKPTSGATIGDAEQEGGTNDKEKTAEQARADAAEALEKLKKEQRDLENAQFDATEKEIRQAIQDTPELKELAQHLLIDRTPEGLRIQVIDREGKPMFPGGSATMMPHTRQLVAQIATAIRSLPNKVRITGHTDSTPFRSIKKEYGNWELSGDRAQASRRVLVEAGLDPERIAAVAGRASRDPLLPDDPTSPRNRRIGILLLRMPPPQDDKTAAGEGTAGKAGGSAKGSGTAIEKPARLDKDWTGPRVK
jgi:chemotaxis protein MotB